MSGVFAKRTLALSVVVGLIGLFGASSASAAQTFGSNLSAPANLSYSVGPSVVTLAHGGLPGSSMAAGGMTAPIGGVIVHWRVKVGALTAPAALRVTRPGDSHTRTGVGTSATVTPPIDSTTEYSSQLPVQAGDALGLDFGPGNIDVLSNTTGAQADEWFPRLVDDEPPRAAFQRANFELLVNADVEPDCDADGLGDETQDPDTSSCNPPANDPPANDTTAPNTTITKGPNDKTKKKTATFEFTGTDTRAVASFQCSLDGSVFASCTSPYTVKVKKGKHAFQVRAIDQAGNVGPPSTDDWRVKRKKRR